MKKLKRLLVMTSMLLAVVVCGYCAEPISVAAHDMARENPLTYHAWQPGKSFTYDVVAISEAELSQDRKAMFSRVTGVIDMLFLGEKDNHRKIRCSIKVLRYEQGDSKSDMEAFDLSAEPPIILDFMDDANLGVMQPTDRKSAENVIAAAKQGRAFYRATRCVLLATFRLSPDAQEPDKVGSLSWNTKLGLGSGGELKCKARPLRDMMVITGMEEGKNTSESLAAIFRDGKIVSAEHRAWNEGRGWVTQIQLRSNDNKQE